MDLEQLQTAYEAGYLNEEGKNALLEALAATGKIKCLKVRKIK